MGLVHVERGVGPVLLWDRGSAHAPLPHPCNDERAEEPRGVLAQRSLRNTDEQQPAFIDEGFDVALGCDLADDRSNRTPKEERAKLVEQRRDVLGALLLGKSLVPTPEGRESADVREPLADGPAPVEVGQEQWHLGERRAGDLGKRQACGAHDVVRARPPPRLVDAFEHAGDVIDD